MKGKRICIWMMIMLLLTACQESPKSDIIVNKNEDRLEQAIQEKNPKEPESEEPKAVFEHKKDEFNVTTGDITVFVDADVEAVREALPVIKVKPHDITSEELQTWGKVLFGEEKAYDPGSPKSKKELEEKILEWKEWRTHLDEQYDGEALERIKKYYDDVIENLELSYNQAQEEVLRKETDYAFHPYEYYLEEGDTLSPGDPAKKDLKFMAETDYKDGIKKAILATNRTESDYCMHAISFYLESRDGILDITKDCSKEEAALLAEKIKEQLGMTDWVLVEPSQIDNGFLFEYARCYEDISVLTGYEINLHSEDLYASNLYYETFRIRVEGGKVSELSWYSPMDIVKVENSNVKTLDFEKVYEHFTNQIKSQYSKKTFGLLYEDEEDLKDAEIAVHITSIKEGMFRIKVKDESDEYRMVPAWCFKGSASGMDVPVDICVIVNAIDGSIIDIDLGY